MIMGCCLEGDFKNQNGNVLLVFGMDIAAG